MKGQTMRKLWDWYHNHIRLLNIIVSLINVFCLINETWERHVFWMIVDAGFTAMSIYAIHLKRRPPRDDDESDDPMPDAPWGDAIDRCLRQRERV